MHSDKKEITLTCSVDNHRSGWTIVEFLASRFKYHTSSGWEQRVQNRWVKVNGCEVEPGHLVRRDDAVQYTIWHNEPDVDFNYDVLYEDDDIAAVSKSGNIPVHACGVFINNTLIARLKKDLGKSATLCHRLDRETSGVVLIAKNKEANRTLAGSFARGQVQKTYHALVVGEIEGDKFCVDAPVGKIDIRYQYPDEYEYGKSRDLATYLPKRTVDFENGKKASTGFEVEKRGAGYSLLRVVPVEGRTNQIRVHLAHAGHPIVGDKIYMLSGEIREELLKEGLTERVRAALVSPRHLLHCGTLRFPHPTSHKPITVAAELPDDFRAVCERTVDSAG